MSQRRDREVDEVLRLLAPLADTKAELPSFGAIYWRARVRLVLDEASRRRGEVLRPLRLFHLTIGIGAIGVAALVAIGPLFVRVPPGAGLFAVPLLIVMVTAGAYLLDEAGPAS